MPSPPAGTSKPPATTVRRSLFHYEAEGVDQVAERAANHDMSFASTARLGCSVALLDRSQRTELMVRLSYAAGEAILG